MKALAFMRKWLGVASPSEAAQQAGREWGEAWAEGIRRGEARRKAGLPPEPLSPEAIAYAERVVHRSFPSLYDDGDDG